MCREKLDNIKLKNFKLEKEFFLEFKKSCKYYVAAESSLSKKEKTRYMLEALTPSHSQIGLYMDVVPPQNQNVKYLRSKIREVNMSRNKSHKKLARSMYNQKVSAIHATSLDINKRIVSMLLTIRVETRSGMQKEVITKNKNIIMIRKKVPDSNEVTVKSGGRAVNHYQHQHQESLS